MVVKLVEKHNGTEYIPVTPHTLPFQDDIPGPGFYNVIHQSPVSNSVSLSKKGTCTFPSVVRTPSLECGHELTSNFLHRLHNHILDIWSLLSKGLWL